MAAPFGVSRQVFGQALAEKLQQRTPAGQASLLGQQLRNRLTEQRIAQEEEMFPMRMEQLKQQIDFAISPEKKIAAEEQALRLKTELDTARQLAVEAARGQYAKELRAIPTRHITQTIGPGREAKFPLAALRGVYTPESIADYRATWEKGAPDEGVLKPVTKTDTERPLTGAQLERKEETLVTSPVLEEIAKDLGVDIKAGFFERRLAGADEAAMKQEFLSQLLGGGFQIPEGDTPEKKEKYADFKRRLEDYGKDIGVTPTLSKFVWD